MNNSKGKYYIKRNASDSFVDITTMFDGVAVLSLDGLNERGEALNVYHEQWIDSQTEDFLVANENAIVIRRNVDLNLTVVMSKRYKTTTGVFNDNTLLRLYNTFLDFVCNGSFYLHSTYMNKTAKVACLGSIKPTTQRMRKNSSSFILVTVPLHVIEEIDWV